MKKVLSILVVIIVVVFVLYVVKSPKDYSQQEQAMEQQTSQSFVDITPISHATGILSWDGKVIYMDPTGGGEAFVGKPAADIILVTDIHGDHLSAETLEIVVRDEATLIAPQAVVDELEGRLAQQATAMANGEKIEVEGFSIEAIPMYNIPESEDAYHVKGRGNGYLIEKDGKRVYIAGDTSGIPEMRALKNIDIAFVPMNLPYTMDPDEAAEAVLAFKPKQVYPYHFRQPDGFADVARFKELVNQGDPNIEVVQLEWYK